VSLMVRAEKDGSVFLLAWCPYCSAPGAFRKELGGVPFHLHQAEAVKVMSVTAYVLRCRCGASTALTVTAPPATPPVESAHARQAATS
jgi:hypothetical protein